MVDRTNAIVWTVVAVVIIAIAVVWIGYTRTERDFIDRQGNLNAGELRESLINIREDVREGKNMNKTVNDLAEIRKDLKDASGAPRGGLQAYRNTTAGKQLQQLDSVLAKIERDLRTGSRTSALNSLNQVINWLNENMQARTSTQTYQDQMNQNQQRYRMPNQTYQTQQIYKTQNRTY